MILSLICGFAVLFLLVILFFLSYKKKSFYIDLSTLLVVISLSDFFKRLIYLNGPVDSYAYYILVLLPDAFFIALMLSKMKYWSRKKTIVYIGLIGLLTFNAIVAGNSIGTIVTGIKAAYMFLFFFCFREEYYSINKASIKTMFYTLLFLMGIALIYSSFQFFVGYTSWEYNWGEFSPTEQDLYLISNFGKNFRAFSIFSGLQTQAVMTVLFLVLSWYLTVKRDYFTRLLLLISFVFLLFITGSKGFMLGALLVSCIMVVRKRLNPFLMLIVLLLPLTIYLLSIPFIYFISDKMYALGSLGSLFSPETLVPRIMIFLNFSQKLSMGYNLIIGHGFSTFGGVMGHTDNMYLSILFELGIVGLILFFILEFKFFKLYFQSRYIVKQKLLKGLLDVALFLNLVILISMYTSESLSSKGILLIYILSIVVMWSANNHIVREISEKEDCCCSSVK